MDNKASSGGMGCVYAVVLLLSAAIALFLWSCFSGEFRLGD